MSRAQREIERRIHERNYAQRECEACAETAKAAIAEIARLRSALDAIAHREPWKGRKDYDRGDAGLADYWSDMAKEFQATARAALKGNGEEKS